MFVPLLTEGDKGSEDLSMGQKRNKNAKENVKTTENTEEKKVNTAEKDITAERQKLWQYQESSHDTNTRTTTNIKVWYGSKYNHTRDKSQITVVM